MLTRIYGTAFFNKEDLDEHLHNIEEAKKRDHRRLGKDSTSSLQRALAGLAVLARRRA